MDAFIRFRTRTLGLYSSKLWFTYDRSINSVCPLCSDGPEDEIHFLFLCKEYADLRKFCFIFTKYKLQRYNYHRLLTSENPYVIKAYALFLAKASKVRKEKLDCLL